MPLKLFRVHRREDNIVGNEGLPLDSLQFSFGSQTDLHTQRAGRDGKNSSHFPDGWVAGLISHGASTRALSRAAATPVGLLICPPESSKFTHGTDGLSYTALSLSCVHGKGSPARNGGQNVQAERRRDELPIARIQLSSQQAVTFSG